MKQSRILLGAGLGLAVQGAIAQDEGRDNIGHARHKHRHGEKHAVVPAEPERFATGREQGRTLVLPAEQDSFTFAVFGDRTGGPTEGVAVLADAVRDVNLLEPDLVMTVGDLIEGYNRRAEWLVQMREFRGIMDELVCPWFPVAGNHDIYWRGPDEAQRPEGEHEAAYEMHFGPLWYAFEHKNCWFVSLFSDEGDPATGEKTFSRPESQKMSPEQFEWLKGVLERAREADHVFLFLHHPRWLRGGYGNDWEKVHRELVAAGNVSAVFAGHIHRMRSDPRDGIEYVTLATTGGHQPGVVPEAGYLHHFDLVTVRKDQIALAAVPVGEVMDVREITGAMVEETVRLSRMPLVAKGRIALSGAGVTEEIALTVSNPVSRPVEVTVDGSSGDSRWSFTPDHHHFRLEPGKEKTLAFLVHRFEGSLDAAVRRPSLSVEMEYLAKGCRYRIPTRHVPLGVELELADRPAPERNRALSFDGENDYVAVPSGNIEPGETLTLEGWFKARGFGHRTGLVTKTESSEYGLFVSEGRPGFSLLIGFGYVELQADAPMLKTGVWHHLAGVYDGQEARLYVDGVLVDRESRQGERRRNELPLVVGADVDRHGGAVSHFAGEIDSVRLSRVARYAGEEAKPDRTFQPDEDTVLLLTMDDVLGDWCPDTSGNGAHGETFGNPAAVPVE